MQIVIVIVIATIPKYSYSYSYNSQIYAVPTATVSAARVVIATETAND